MEWSPPPPCTSGQPHNWLLGNPEPHTGIVRGQCRLCDVQWWWPRPKADGGGWKTQKTDVPELEEGEEAVEVAGVLEE